MGKRNRVKANTKMNKNGNGETSISTSSTSMKMSRGGNQTTGNKAGGGGNGNKKMKGGVSLNSSCVGIEVGAGQSQETKVKEASVNNFPPENANVNGEPSSSSLYWTRSRKQDPELKESEFTRKRKIDEAADEDEVVTEGPINNLPPEMLTKILKNVDHRSLFKCRIVSRQWLEISSEILFTRADSILRFKEYDFKRVAIRRGPLKFKKNNRLQEFVECIKKCKNVPFTRFSFRVGGPSFFDGKDWIQFLSILAPSKNVNPKQNQNQRTKIKYLQFLWYSINSTKELLHFTEKLRDLLLNKIPRLEEFGLDFFTTYDSENVKLFPSQKNTKLTTATIKSSASVQLPYLKVVEIEAGMFLDFPGIITDLLNAAVNLTEIRVEHPCLAEGVFQFLYSHGKLHFVKKVEIDFDEDFLSDMKKSAIEHPHSKPDFLLGFKLHELKLNAFSSDIDEELYNEATKLISHILESSKDTLEKLEMSQLGFLDGLQFPKFKNLKTLELQTCRRNNEQLGGPFFPPGIRSVSRSREIFLDVNNLIVMSDDWSSAFPQEDSIPIFPRVDTFCIIATELAENVITKLVLMCPNLKHCEIKTFRGNPEEFSFLQVGRSIWTHLNQLESLEVDLEVNLEAHAFPALDSCFTGISMENCQRLQDLMEVEKTRNENSSQFKLPESEEIKKLTKREHPSILDMTSLKKFVINPHSGKKRHQGKNFFTTKITWISEEFAFKLMPQLQFNGRRPSATS